jgi:hypothetical protein
VLLSNEGNIIQRPELANFPPPFWHGSSILLFERGPEPTAPCEEPQGRLVWASVDGTRKVVVDRATLANANPATGRVIYEVLEQDGRRRFELAYPFESRAPRVLWTLPASFIGSGHGMCVRAYASVTFTPSGTHFVVGRGVADEDAISERMTMDVFRAEAPDGEQPVALPCSRSLLPHVLDEGLLCRRWIAFGSELVFLPYAGAERKLDNTIGDIRQLARTRWLYEHYTDGESLDGQFRPAELRVLDFGGEGPTGPGPTFAKGYLTQVAPSPPAKHSGIIFMSERPYQDLASAPDRIRWHVMDTTNGEDIFLPDVVHRPTQLISSRGAIIYGAWGKTEGSRPLSVFVGAVPGFTN